jgi:hypothetical protein
MRTCSQPSRPTPDRVLLSGGSACRTVCSCRAERLLSISGYRSCRRYAPWGPRPASVCTQCCLLPRQPSPCYAKLRNKACYDRCAPKGQRSPCARNGVLRQGALAVVICAGRHRQYSAACMLCCALAPLAFDSGRLRCIGYRPHAARSAQWHTKEPFVPHRPGLAAGLEAKVEQLDREA